MRGGFRMKENNVFNSRTLCRVKQINLNYRKNGLMFFKAHYCSCSIEHWGKIPTRFLLNDFCFYFEKHLKWQRRAVMTCFHMLPWFCWKWSFNLIFAWTENWLLMIQVHPTTFRTVCLSLLFWGCMSMILWGEDRCIHTSSARKH